MSVRRWVLLFLLVVTAAFGSTFIGRDDTRGGVEQLLLELPPPRGATTSAPTIIEPNDRVLQEQFGLGAIVWSFDEAITSPDDALLLIDDHFLGLGYERLSLGANFVWGENATPNTYYGNDKVVWKTNLFEGTITARLTWSSDKIQGMNDGDYVVRVVPFACGALD